MCVFLDDQLRKSGILRCRVAKKFVTFFGRPTQEVRDRCLSGCQKVCDFFWTTNSGSQGSVISGLPTFCWLSAPFGRGLNDCGQCGVGWPRPSTPTTAQRPENNYVTFHVLTTMFLFISPVGFNRNHATTVLTGIYHSVGCTENLSLLEIRIFPGLIIQMLT